MRSPPCSNPAAERDRTGIVPAEIVNTYSNSGLWGITVPRRFGG